jgi:predicted metal-dependent HD superfamily phosphohydrolase
MTAFNHMWMRVSGREGRSVYETVAARYEEAHRHYHTLAHIAACLTELGQTQVDDESRNRIELAIWFHDAVYDVPAKNNEVRSAEFFKKIATEHGVEPTLTEDVIQMIKATAKHEIPPHCDTYAMRLLLDIDLSILGATPERFQEYNENIRQEYASVPNLIYVMKRKQALRRFLDRPNLFFTPEFCQRYEQQARTNIQGLL